MTPSSYDSNTVGVATDTNNVANATAGGTVKSDCDTAYKQLAEKAAARVFSRHKFCWFDCCLGKLRADINYMVYRGWLYTQFQEESSRREGVYVDIDFDYVRSLTGVRKDFAGCHLDSWEDLEIEHFFVFFSDAGGEYWNQSAHIDGNSLLADICNIDGICQKHQNTKDSSCGDNCGSDSPFAKVGSIYEPQICSGTIKKSTSWKEPNNYVPNNNGNANPPYGCPSCTKQTPAPSPTTPPTAEPVETGAPPEA